LKNQLLRRIQCFGEKLDDLSDKKVINLLYIDQQDYDNPILRKELVALSNRKKDLRDRAKEIILKPIATVRLMIKIMCFSFYPKLSTQRTYRLVTSRNYFGSDVINRFELNALSDNSY
jgi:hypothetical protein